MGRTGPDRRAVLAGLAALGVGSALPALAAPASAPIKVGALELRTVTDGSLRLPVGFLLPATPPDEIAKLFRAAGQEMPEQFASPASPTLVRTGDQLVLLDAGSGPHFMDTAGKIDEALQAAGVAHDAITRVVFTHAHPDHLWGVLDDLDDERFPNATYVVPAAEWDFWTDPNTISRVPESAQGMAAGTARILKRIEGKVERRRAGETVAPGLTYLDTAGHTPGHMAVVAESGGERLIVGGDVLGHPLVSFQRPDWHTGTDVDPEAGARTRARLLDMLATDRIPLIGYHLPLPGVGRVERAGTAYRFVPA